MGHPHSSREDEEAPPQLIEGLPENLWLWLERTPASAFKLTSRQITKRREKAFIRAGLLVTAAMARKDKITKKSPPKNCLRHSFATYHVALHRDPGNTALLISHKNQNILYEHYLGVASKKDAERYFGIVPRTEKLYTRSAVNSQ